MNVYDTGLALLEGRLSEVEERARESFLVGQRVEHPFARGVNDAQSALLLRERGDHEGLVERFGPAVGARQGPRYWVKAVVARSLFALGREDETRRFWAELATRGFEDIPRDLRWIGSMVEIAGLCADLGDADIAPRLEELLAPYETLHGVLPTAILYGGPVTWQLARLRELAGRGDQATELYEDALDAARRLGARPTAARIECDLARLLVLQGRADRARSLLESAANAADVIGMQGLAAGAHEQLGKLS